MAFHGRTKQQYISGDFRRDNMSDVEFNTL